MAESTLRDGKRIVAVFDVAIDTEVGDKVVDVVSSWCFLVLVLCASGGRADWVGVDLGLSLHKIVNFNS